MEKDRERHLNGGIRHAVRKAVGILSSKYPDIIAGSNKSFLLLLHFEYISEPVLTFT